MNTFLMSFLAVCLLSIIVSRTTLAETTDGYDESKYLYQATYEWRHKNGLKETPEQTIERFRGYMLTGGDALSQDQYFFQWKSKSSSWDMNVFETDQDDGKSTYNKDDLNKFKPFNKSEHWSVYPARNYIYSNCEPTPTGEELEKNKAKIKELSQISDFFKVLPDMRTRQIGKDGPVVTLKTMTEKEMVANDQLYDWLFNLFVVNMKELYQKYWVYNEKKEKGEYAVEDTGFLFAYIEGEKDPVGFNQFAFILENNKIIMYVLELQVVQKVHKKLIGMYIIYALTRMASYYGVEKLEGICLRKNYGALQFYRDIEVTEDAIMSPPARPYFPVPEDADYMPNLYAPLVLAGFATEEKMKYFEKRLEIAEDEKRCCVESDEIGKCCCISQKTSTCKVSQS